ncbi:MAG: glycosyltransferase [Verrucomicrobiota bacterium]
MNPAASRPTLGVIIRFKNSARTLPDVLAALRRQTVQPDLIVGVDNQSTDHSVALMKSAGAQVFNWTEPYKHPRVLNFAVRHCPTDLVLILSSHTVLNSPDAISQLVGTMSDPQTACASARWDDDPFYSDAITWSELKSKGLKFGSIYSNSMGIFRRRLWESVPFDESVPTMEDSAWTLEQLKRGHTCQRLKFDFSYQRSGNARYFIFAVVTFHLAHQHHLKVCWLGPKATCCMLGKHLLRWALHPTKASDELAGIQTHKGRLAAWLFWPLAYKIFKNDR